MIQLNDRTLENETLRLDSRDEVHYLGHNLTLKNCALIIKVPGKRLVIAKTRFLDCTLEAKQELKGFWWDSAMLQGCTFKGRFTGCEFGGRPSAPEEGAVVDCDFTEARLHWCGFTACDASRLRFPPWPCFTLLEPVRWLHEWKGVSWPGKAGLLISTLAGATPQTSAVTLHAPSLAREMDTTEEALKAALQGLGGVIY